MADEPYLYSLMWQTEQEGISMLRIPALVFPGDRELRKINDEMMLENSILVRPVTRPMYYGPHSTPLEEVERCEKVYLPAGHLWYVPDTGEGYEGGQTVCVPAPLDRIPAFVRSGSILPRGARVQSTEELAGQMPELVVFPGEDGEFTLYDDAGDGYAYETGCCSRILLRWEERGHVLRAVRRQDAPDTTARVRLCGQPAREWRMRGEESYIVL